MSIVVTATRLTPAVGSLVLRCLRRTAITRSSWLYTYHNRQGLKQGDISRKLQQKGIKATELGIAKFLAKFIESGSVARKRGSGRPSKRNGPPYLGKRCRRATQTERTVFRTFLDAYRIQYASGKNFHTVVRNRDAV